MLKLSAMLRKIYRPDAAFAFLTLGLISSIFQAEPLIIISFCIGSIFTSLSVSYRNDD